MKIEKEVITKVLTTDGKEINVGDVVVFNAGSQCFTGSFLGSSKKKGALMFGGVIAGTDVQFNVMPRSITEIYLADVKVVRDETEPV